MSEKLLNEDIRTHILEIFADLVHPVEIVHRKCAYAVDCEVCRNTATILSEVAELTSQIEIIEPGESDRDLPEHALTIRRSDREAGDERQLGFWGTPVGHEFSVLINDIVLVSRDDPGFSEETRREIAEFRDPIHLQVYVTPT